MHVDLRFVRGRSSLAVMADPHGEPVGAVELPPGGEIVRLDESSLYVTVREGRAMYLVRYRLVKPAG